MKKGVLCVLLCLKLGSPAQAQDTVKLLINTDPQGATIVYHNNHRGQTGNVIILEPKDLPKRSNADFSLERPGYEKYQLLIPPGTLQFQGDNIVTYPATPIKLDPSHWWIPLKEHPVRPFLALCVLMGAAYLVRRNRNLKQAIDTREAREAHLQNQIKNKHEFAFSIIGNYRVLEELGQGGIAKVYRGVPDQTLDESESVAIKILHPHLCREPGHRDRFVREGRVSKQLQHPNIVRLEELDTEGEVVYLILELLQGQTLKAMAGGEKLSLRKTFEVVDQIFSGLCYAHSKGVVHRDLTPSNIMVTENGTVKLMDFGLARNREVGHTVTVTGVVQGTPGYMAPEQLNETLDARTDQYSLGVILFELLTGRRPIERSDPMQLIMATFTEDAPDPRIYEAEIPAPVAEFILKLLSRDPELRFRDMDEAAKAFHEAFRGGV